VGVVPDESNLYPELSGIDNLRFCAALYGMGKDRRESRARELVEMFGLSEAADRKFGTYSKGMKRKLTIAAGMIHSPGILFLDEPTTGIDVASARLLRQVIDGMHRSGVTVFLTTHYIEEAERLCDRIAFIVSGRIVVNETREHLLEPVRNRHVLAVTCGGLPQGIVERLAEAFPDLVFAVSGTGELRVESKAPVGVGPLVRFLEDRGAEVTEARRVKPSLEDVFVRITGLGPTAMKKEREGRGGAR
jgi:ABC-2 type transport system ATP-binding protein